MRRHRPWMPTCFVLPSPVGRSWCRRERLGPSPGSCREIAGTRTGHYCGLRSHVTATGPKRAASHWRGAATCGCGLSWSSRRSSGPAPLKIGGYLQSVRSHFGQRDAGDPKVHRADADPLLSQGVKMSGPRSEKREVFEKRTAQLLQFAVGHHDLRCGRARLKNANQPCICSWKLITLTQISLGSSRAQSAVSLSNAGCVRRSGPPDVPCPEGTPSRVLRPQGVTVFPPKTYNFVERLRRSRIALQSFHQVAR